MIPPPRVFSFSLTVAATLENGCVRRSNPTKPASKSAENASTIASGFSPSSAICRRCDSDDRWHRNPFSSRHCLAHIWQYQRRRPRPFCFWRLASWKKGEGGGGERVE